MNIDIVRKIKCLFAALVLCSNLSLAAQYQQNLPFKHLGLRDGLSGQYITGIERDSDGLVWIATNYGLYSFDGYRIKDYPTISGEMPNSRAFTIDSNGDIWLLGYNNLYYLRHIYNNVWGEEKVLTEVTPEEATSGKCHEYIIGMKRTEKFGMIFWDEHSLSNYDGSFSLDLPELVTDLAEGSSSLFFITFSGKIYNIRSDGEVVCFANVNNIESKNLRLMRDSSYRLWVYDTIVDFFCCFDDNGNLLCNDFIDNLKSLTPITHIAERQGILHFATNNNGLAVVDAAGNISNINCDDSNPLSLTNNHLSHVYIDSFNRIWLGSSKVGVEWTSSEPHTLSLFQTNVKEDIACFGEMSNGQIIIGYDGGGLQIGDDLLTEENSSLPTNLIIGLNPCKDGYLVGTYGSGLLHLGTQSRKISLLPLINDSIRSAIELTKFAIEDLRGRLWVGTMRNGLYVLEREPKSRKFAQKAIFSLENQAFRTDCVTALAITQDQRYVVAATSTGLYRIDTNTFEVKVLEAEDMYLSSITDRQGNIWVGTYNGLKLLDIEGEVLKDFGKEYKSLNAHVISLAEDYNGNIIIATPNSLHLVCRFSYGKYDVRTLSTASTTADITFTQNAIYTKKDGSVLVGGNACYTSTQTNPALPLFPSLPEIHFTSIVLDGKDVYSLVDYIPSNHSITIEISDYSCWDDTRFEYRLDGGTWMSAYDNMVMLGHLIPGRYTLEVRHTDNQDEPISILRFQVGHWWEHWIFVTFIYVILALTLIYIFRKMWQKMRNVKPFHVNATTIKDEAPDAQFLVRIAQIIEDNLADENFSVEDLADNIGMSRSNLFRRLKSLTGQTPIELIQDMRLQKAKQKLTQSGASISQVSYEVGLTPRRLTALFKKKFGKTPSQVIEEEDQK